MARLLHTLKDFPATLHGCALAIGNFDGVHLGHAQLVRTLVSKSKELGGPAVVLTFDPPPVTLLAPDRPTIPPLTSISRRAELLGDLGVDALVAYPTDHDLLSLSAEQFFQLKIQSTLHAQAVVEGPNFRFGKDRAGDVALLRDLCDAAGLDLEVVSAQENEGEMISSTRIRQCLAEGAIEAVNSMLTQPYSLDGTVGQGSQRGRQIGFPTANLVDVGSMIPARGVYAGEVLIDGAPEKAAIHIGPNPTFGEQQDKLEVHVIDWEGTLYGQELRCFLTKRVRDVKQFDGLDALKQQLELDIAACRAG